MAGHGGCQAQGAATDTGGGRPTTAADEARRRERARVCAEAGRRWGERRPRPQTPVDECGTLNTNVVVGHEHDPRIARLLAQPLM
jgi:hypothetical protein